MTPTGVYGFMSPQIQSPMHPGGGGGGRGRGGSFGGKSSERLNFMFPSKNLIFNKQVVEDSVVVVEVEVEAEVEFQGIVKFLAKQSKSPVDHIKELLESSRTQLKAQRVLNFTHHVKQFLLTAITSQS